MLLFNAAIRNDDKGTYLLNERSRFQNRMLSGIPVCRGSMCTRRNVRTILTNISGMVVPEWWNYG